VAPALVPELRQARHHLRSIKRRPPPMLLSLLRQSQRQDEAVAAGPSSRT
jgi:hypothetical protein